MKIALGFLFFSAIVCFVNAGADFSAEFLKEIDGMKCRPGFLHFPTLLIKGISECTLQSMNIASLECFKTCVYRDINVAYQQANGTEGIDYGAADALVMDAYDMTERQGRMSYFEITNNVRVCGTKFLSVPGNKFANVFSEAKDCEKGDEFFSCCTSIFKTCPAAVTEPPSTVKPKKDAFLDA